MRCVRIVGAIADPEGVSGEFAASSAPNAHLASRTITDGSLAR